MNRAAYEKLGIKPCDAAEYLQSDEDCAAYLQACLEQAPDDASVFAKALGNIACARGMMQLAKDTGLTREGLYKSFGEQGNPSLSTFMKVMHALGLQMHIGPHTAA